jgi:Uma2 family endonuclease
VSRLIDRPLTAQEYEKLAWAYYKTLPMEHFMESTDQATQRKIALESLDLVNARRPEVQIYSELLVQYRVGKQLRRVVPDNMVVLNATRVQTKSSYNLELEGVGPLWVLEWVSYRSKGKDYGEAFRKYERDLKVPYCLMYYPEKRDLRMHHHDGKRYQRLSPNVEGRMAIPELELEIGMLEGWVRCWFRGELLPLPADLQAANEALRKQANRQRRRAAVEKRRAEEEKRRADKEKQKRLAAEEELARLKAVLQQASGNGPAKNGPSKPK